MNSIHMRMGVFFVSLLAGFSQHALSAALMTFVDGSGEQVSCGNVADLKVTSAEVVATGTDACLIVTVSTSTPTAEPHDLGTVDTNNSGSKNVTDKAVVKLPLPGAPVTIVSKPALPGASVGVSGGVATYYAPSSEDITASADDSFTYRITDATGAASNAAKVDVHVNWVAVKSDGCTPSSTVVCMGETPRWPTFHENIAHYLAGGTTHVWSFVYEGGFTGLIAAGLSAGNKNMKISETPGDTAIADLDCWRDFGDSVLYELAPPAVDIYRCDLKEGYRYYFNVRNLDAIATTYELKGSGY